MFVIRKASERGQAEHGWLHAKHSFSFGEYYDAKYMGFRNLCVINEDKVEPSKGFPTHSHQNMEIVTYVLSTPVRFKESSTYSFLTTLKT